MKNSVIDGLFTYNYFYKSANSCALYFDGCTVINSFLNYRPNDKLDLIELNFETGELIVYWKCPIKIGDMFKSIELSRGKFFIQIN